MITTAPLPLRDTAVCDRDRDLEHERASLNMEQETAKRRRILVAGERPLRADDIVVVHVDSCSSLPVVNGSSSSSNNTTSDCTITTNRTHEHPPIGAPTAKR